MTAPQLHLDALRHCLATLEDESDRIAEWGERLAAVLTGGGRLLAVGNGGSAAQAQHLTSELVGRYRLERAPYAAIALHCEPCVLSAIGNDYGVAEQFARQVLAHGRAGDVLIALSTSGASANVLHAARAARSIGMIVWALTGANPNDLGALADDAVALPAEATATIQEAHLVAVHLLCEALDEAVAQRAERRAQAAFA
jgi:D-sedoheptulose 7-phosphate isomerase